jgi:hypothetical protein
MEASGAERGGRGGREKTSSVKVFSTSTGIPIAAAI